MKGRTILALITVGAVLAVPQVRAQAPAGQPAPPDAPPAGDVEPPDSDGDRPLGDDEAMVLNFERADIREVIHSLATALGLSYTIDPRIEGQVTIRTTGKIARKDLFPLFNEILRNNGIAAVKQGEYYQMLPVAEAKTRAIIPTGAARDGMRLEDSFVIEIVSLRHVAAEEMANILQPFVTPGGDVLSYPRANALVITDIDSNVRRLRELVATFDVDGFHNLHAHVFKLKEGDPDELANELLNLLAPYGVTATGEGEAGLSLVPLSRLDAIVAFAIDKTAFDAIERWLAILDVPPDQTSGRQTFVYNVENAKAADLAAVLNELFGGGPGGGGGGLGRNPGGQPGGIGLFGAGGTSGATGGLGRGRGGVGGGVGGGGGVRGGGRGGIGGGGFGGGGMGGAAAGDTSQGLRGGATGGVGGVGGAAGGVGGAAARRRAGAGGGIGGAAAGAAAGQQGAVLGVSLPGGPQGAPGGPGAGGQFGTQGPPPIFKEEVRIVADDVTNSLVILATKRDYQLILDVVKKIDVVPRQVVLEVTIAEVELNKSLEFGVAYALADGTLSAAVPANAGDATLSSPSIFSLAKTNNVAGLFADAARFPPGQGFAVISGNNYQIFLRALQTLTNVKMLSAPHIIAADNREAHILVGESIPILTSSSTSVVANSQTINQVQYRDTGKILTVLPQVNSLGLVNMQIRQEVSAVADKSFGSTNSPSFTTREAETTVVVQDGETVLIGGIIDDTIRHDRQGLPYLMDVPVLGFLFRTETNDLQRVELLITITPSVIRNLDEARRVTSDYTDRIQGLAGLRRSIATHRSRRQGRIREEYPARPAEPPGLSVEP
ncbi:MAG TPA: type II secretion system secretin GspD [Candidatus Eisenbacteria bacterium]|nr:type II secretion system secretin GspD [Candidatus Eisenbacteria bacterium]